MAGSDAQTASRELRLLSMLDSMTRALSGVLSVPEAIADVADAMRELLDFERMAVMRIAGEDTLRVHAAVHGQAWPLGRLLHKKDCSPRLWIDWTVVDRIADTARELDRSFPMDREIIDRGTASVLRVPLVGRSGPIGMLAFSSPRPEFFTPEDEHTAAAIAGLVAMALEHERLHEEHVQRQQRDRLLEAALPRVAQARELEEIATCLWEVSPGLVPREFVTVAVIHSDESHFCFHSIIDGARRLQVDAPRELVETQIQAMGNHDYVRVNDIELIPPDRQHMRVHMAWADEERIVEAPMPTPMMRSLVDSGIHSQLRLAVRRGSTLLGIVAFGSREPRCYTEEHVDITRRLAGQVSLTLAHDRLSSERLRAAEASERARELENRVALLQRELEQSRGTHAVVGHSKSWRDVLGQATRVANTDTTVLLTGESGTGKEVVARFLHHASPRAGGPFVAVNCAALPEQLLEAELFGHEKGAFTGAATARVGRVEQAAGGVLFLDEVGEISPAVQAKFLRVLQEREFQRLGSARVIKADVRVIAATNRDLRAAISAGDFREDLFYRLNVFAIHLPPLRDRPDDVLVLADHFIKELGATLGRGDAGMTPDARDALRHYGWPGNARELRNVIERALILSDGGLVHPGHLAFAPAGAVAVAEPASLDGLADGPLPARGIDLEAIERSLVQRAMTQVAGNKSRAARLLGLSRAQLYSRLEKYRIS